MTGLLSTRKAVLLSICILIVSLLAVVYALILTQAQQVDVQVLTESPGVDIKIYSDAGCTQLVTSLDVNLGQGEGYAKRLYIKNHGEGTYILYCNSDLPTVSNKIVDFWGTYQGYPGPLWNNPAYHLNGTSIGPGGVCSTYYNIVVPADTPLSTYSWTLTLYVGS